MVWCHDMASDRESRVYCLSLFLLLAFFFPLMTGTLRIVSEHALLWPHPHCCSERYNYPSGGLSRQGPIGCVPPYWDMNGDLWFILQWSCMSIHSPRGHGNGWARRMRIAGGATKPFHLSSPRSLVRLYPHPAVVS